MRACRDSEELFQLILSNYFVDKEHHSIQNVSYFEITKKYYRCDLHIIAKFSRIIYKLESWNRAENKLCFSYIYKNDVKQYTYLSLDDLFGNYTFLDDRQIGIEDVETELGGTE